LSWNPNSWYRTATELLVELEKHPPENVVKSQYWPKGASVLSNRLKRHAPAFRAMGIDVDLLIRARERPNRESSG
jgi:hypothetical protein